MASVGQNARMLPVLLVHGGAGDVSDERVPPKVAGIKMAANAGYAVLAAGGSVTDAVLAAVHVMEDDEHFNAGFGSVLTKEGEVEMDALLMEGAGLRAGAVGAVADVRHAIDLAQVVLERTPHTLLVSGAARRLAEEHGLPLAPPGGLVTPQARGALRQALRTGDTTMHDTGGNVEGEEGKGGSTVGAVAVDASGRCASATSTGGTSGKMAGRVGDTALVGCGGYADDSVGCVSTTGHGESIIKTNLAHSIIVLMEQGVPAQEAAQKALDELGRRLRNTAGAIVLSTAGDVGVAFISKRMPWAFRQGHQLHYGVDQGQHCVETVEEAGAAAAK